MSRYGHFVRLGFPRNQVLEIAAGMSDPDPKRAGFCTQVWADSWKEAIRMVREFNDRELLEDMLDIGHPVPSEIARELLDLKGPEHRPSATGLSPEEVVFFVRAGISEGHPFPASNGSNAGDSAFDVVAQRIGCSTSAVAARYKQCPRETREAIKQRRKEFGRFWKEAERETFTTDEEARDIKEALKILRDALGVPN